MDGGHLKARESFIAFVCITQIMFSEKDKVPWYTMANATLSLVMLGKAIGTRNGYYIAITEYDK